VDHLGENQPPIVFTRKEVLLDGLKLKASDAVGYLTPSYFTANAPGISSPEDRRRYLNGYSSGNPIFGNIKHIPTNLKPAERIVEALNGQPGQRQLQSCGMSDCPRRAEIITCASNNL
jgi:hypothetical protein